MSLRVGARTPTPTVMDGRRPSAQFLTTVFFEYYQPLDNSQRDTCSSRHWNTIAHSRTSKTNKPLNSSVYVMTCDQSECQHTVNACFLSTEFGLRDRADASVTT